MSQEESQAKRMEWPLSTWVQAPSWMAQLITDLESGPAFPVTAKAVTKHREKQNARKRVRPVILRPFSER